MADFCKQCSDDDGFENSFALIGTNAKQLFPVLCETCGPTIVDWTGMCVGRCDVDTHYDASRRDNDPVLVEYDKYRERQRKTIELI